MDDKVFILTYGLSKHFFENVWTHWSELFFKILFDAFWAWIMMILNDMVNTPMHFDLLFLTFEENFL